MQFVGRTINITSERTGKVVNLDFAISSCFPSSFEYQQFLISLYMKDYGVYQAYSKLLLMYLTANPNQLSESEILENKTIISTINAMFIVRDRQDKEDEKLAHYEMQAFINTLTKKQK